MIDCHVRHIEHLAHVDDTAERRGPCPIFVDDCVAVWAFRQVVVIVQVGLGVETDGEIVVHDVQYFRSCADGHCETVVMAPDPAVDRTVEIHVRRNLDLLFLPKCQLTAGCHKQYDCRDDRSGGICTVFDHNILNFIPVI